MICHDMSHHIMLQCNCSDVNLVIINQNLMLFKISRYLNVEIILLTRRHHRQIDRQPARQPRRKMLSDVTYVINMP